MNQCPVHFIQHGKLVRKQSRKLRVSNNYYQILFRGLGFSSLPHPKLDKNIIAQVYSIYNINMEIQTRKKIDYT